MKKDRQTLEQIESIITLCDEKGMTKERMTRILATGILADIFDERAFLDRQGVQKVLHLYLTEPAKPSSSLISLASGVFITATRESKVAASFRGPHIAYRDANIDHWLMRSIPRVGGGISCSFTFDKRMGHARAVADHLGSADVHKEHTTALYQKQKCFSLGQVDRILSDYEKGINPLKIDGKLSCLFPVSDGRSVDFIRAFRVTHGWIVHIFRYLGIDEWQQGSVIAFRN